jgi:transcriptional regulator with XRE-family HTH domain
LSSLPVREKLTAFNIIDKMSDKSTIRGLKKPIAKMRTESATPTDDSREVGERLRALREARRLSQREVARISGVSHSIISQIERGDSNPSVSLLRKVLSGLSLSLGEFFSMPADRIGKVFFRRDELPRIADGPLRLLQVGGNVQHRHRIQILHEHYAPGADTGEILMTHDAEEGGVIIKGKLEITVGDQVAVLGPGDAYYFDSRLPHRMRNVGKTECVVVSACSPPSF